MTDDRDDYSPEAIAKELAASLSEGREINRDPIEFYSYMKGVEAQMPKLSFEAQVKHDIAVHDLATGGDGVIDDSED